MQLRPGLRMRKRRETVNLTIHRFCMTANFFDALCDYVAMDFQLFGGDTIGQNVKEGCAKSTPT
jgi:hypothetical protein